MTVKLIQDENVINLEELKLVGFRVLCAEDQYAKEIPKTSMILTNRQNEIKNAINKEIQYGAFIVDTHAESEDGYWVAVAVDKFENIPDGMVTLRIPPQRYATATYHGSNKGIFEAYEQLHKWTFEQGFNRLRDKWHLEMYKSWQDQANLEVELLDTIE